MMGITASGRHPSCFMLMGMLVICGVALGHGVARDAVAAPTTLRWAIGGPPRALDVYRDASLNALVVLNVLYDRLAVLDDLKLRPSLAISWRQTDPLTYVYSLRDDAVFSDGQPVMAADVAFSFMRHIGAGSTSLIAAHLKTLRLVEATGPHEVTVHLKTPDATWIYDPLFVPVVEQQDVQRRGTRYGAPQEVPVSSGPYQLVRFDAEHGIELVRNTRYWGPRGVPDKVTFSYIADPGSLALSLRGGVIDGTFNLSLTFLPLFCNLQDVHCLHGAGLALVSLIFNLEKWPYNDIHVRRAIAYSWPAADFTQKVIHGAGRPANTAVAPGFWSNLLPAGEVAASYASLPTFSFNPQLARRELAASTVAKGFTETVSFPDVYPVLGEALQVLAENLAPLGITLNIKEIPYQRWIGRLAGRTELGLEIAHWNADYPDPSELAVSFYAGSHAVAGQFNISNYRNPSVDRILDRQAVASDPAERASLLMQVLQIVANDIPNVNLYWEDSWMTISNTYKYHDFNGLSTMEQWIYRIDTVSSYQKEANP
ncbi:ABC transporter substrate-binding protein [Komagataeibacter xylinus]|uniref:ABC transporter substrate-binding protein n=1 Tax=Komagataeibacter xylinus TaxID=28448 RepID=A0A857FLM4_KOMXY|nr:ABC transporter substrate-binding protein [Komagataeibacter xylinus]QHC35168.1 ABC transporter substrate-binding protein [Komagataeibacter xylinus]